MDNLVSDLSSCTKPTSIFQFLEKFSPSTPARIALFGRRGAGKTTLLSVLIGMKAGEMSAVSPAKCDNCWKVLQDSDGRSIEVLDTSGFQSVYENEGQHNVEEELIQKALEEKIPDVILFLIKAKEVNSAVKGDLNALAKIVSSIKDTHLTVPPIIVVVSQCDELDPSNIKTEEDKQNYPDDWGIKLGNINASVETIRMNINNYSDIAYYVHKIIPIAAYFRTRRDGSIDKDPRMSFRWNVDHLIETITDSIHNFVSKINFARIAKAENFLNKTNVTIITGASLASFLLSINSNNKPDSIGSKLLAVSVPMLMTVGMDYINGIEINSHYLPNIITTLGIGLSSSITTERFGSEIRKKLPFRKSLAIKSSISMTSTLVLGIFLHNYLKKVRD